MMNDFTIAFSKNYFLATNNDAALASKNVNLFDYSYRPILEFQNQLMRFGYMLDEDTLKYLGAIRPNHFEEIRKTTLDYLKESIGDGNFKTLFGAFPAVVNSMTEMEMFIFTILHYLSDGTFVPSDMKAFHDYMSANRDVEVSIEDDEKSIEDYCKNFKSSYKMIKFFNPQNYNELFDCLVKPLLVSGTSISGYDMDVLEYFAKNHDEKLGKYIEDNNIEIPFKENLCMLASMCKSLKLKTVTDLLRWVAYTSDNKDLTLTTNPVFKNYKRYERRRILERLEYILTNSCYEDSLAEMKGNINYWIRLGEKLHPGEYYDRYPSVANSFKLLRRCPNAIDTFNSKYERTLKIKDFNGIINLLLSRPGEFARRLDAVVRTFADSDESFMKIYDAFSRVINNVSMKVLYELIEHFNNRTESDMIRVIKLPTSSCPIVLNSLDPMNEKYAYDIVSMIYDEIVKRYAAKDKIEGDYIISSDLYSINLPKDMRTKSFSLGQSTRGTGIPFNSKTGVIRCYLRWHDKYGNEDLDLSGTFFSDDLKTTECVSWCTGYKKQFSVFSGDVRHVKGDVAEYIDVDVNEAKHQGMRYLVMRADDYDRNMFNSDAWCGVMELPKFETPSTDNYYNSRRTPNTFEWLPAAVTTGFKITGGKSNGIMAAVIDLYDNMIYVVDDETPALKSPVAAMTPNSQEYAVQMYAKHRPFMNASTVIIKNFETRCNSFEVMSEENIDKYLNRRKELEDEYNTLVNTANVEVDENKRIVLLSLADKIKHNNEKYFKQMPKIIRFTDIAFDYNKLLEYMF